MGNIDSRCHHEYGYIYFKTNKTFYYSGEQVFGTIFMRVVKPMEAKFLELAVKGVE